MEIQKMEFESNPIPQVLNPSSKSKSEHGQDADSVKSETFQELRILGLSCHPAPPISGSAATLNHINHIGLTLSPPPHQSTHQIVVIKQYDDGTKERNYPYVLAAGIERYPLKVTKSMGAKKLAKRSKVKPFVKVSFSLQV